MLLRQTGKKIIAFAVSLILSATFLYAADESYIQSLSGKIKKGDTCTVIDDKFLNLPLEDWNKIHNLSVLNYIIFELRQDTNIYYYKKPFTCTLNVSVRYFTSRDQLTPTEVNDVKLIVRYDTATGKYYPVFDQYTFKNAYKVTVVVNSITSAELGTDIPAIFRIRNQIMVQRIYPFVQVANARIIVEEKPFYPAVEGNNSNERVNTTVQAALSQFTVSWLASDFPGFQEFDVEWTFIDRNSEKGDMLAANPPVVTETMLADWFRFDNTRVTVTTYSHTLNVPAPNGFVLTRVRGVAIHPTTGIRQTTNWQYSRDASNNLQFPVINFLEPNLNWQYTTSYSEGGLQQEILSIFDGSMRSRQAVTLSNTDDVAVVAETVYDKMGRPAISILPAPINDSRLAYYPAINKNSSGTAFTFSDITSGNSSNPCSIEAGTLNISSGASKYYSPNNGFIADPNYYFAKYVPDAEGYPYTLIEYMPDNTGRVRRQSGAGKELRMGTNHETQYFYGKPTPGELYRLFGMEVGNASHYLKNMVIDPNGQISISYVNSQGKTIASALAGTAPPNLDAIPSALAPESRTTKTEVLIRPQDFQSNAGALLKEASATFLAAVKGPYSINYSISPAALGPWNGPAQGQQFCNNCYYEVEIIVRDECGDVRGSTTTTAFQLNSTTCNPNAQPITGSVPVDVQKFGEHTVTYRLRLSEDVIKYQTDYYIANNIDLKKLQTFFHEEMILADLKACYSECSTCMEKLGTLPDFTAKMNALLQKLKDEKYANYTFSISSPEIQAWITSTYNTLLANCQAMAPTCAPLSPCEEKLEIMKNDVRPGGQYLLFDETFTIPFSESGSSIVYNSNGNLLNYKNDPQIPDFEFKDEDGVIRHIKDGAVTTAMFIKAYMAHPEWANDFVKRHIEYCSYLWCKSGNNESSYTFDEKLRQTITKGSVAVSKGYYSQSDPYALLNHPEELFFKPGGAGYPYYSDMRRDLDNLSAVLRIRFKDQNGNFLYTKDILQLVDWMLYCKPNDPSATSQAYVDSWNNCVPASNCRSLTNEWELYRDYYLKLKSKYMRLAKLAAVPNCENCFIGQDPMSASVCEDPGSVSNYQVAGPSQGKYVQFMNGTQPFKGNYKITLTNSNGTFVVYTQKGTYKKELPVEWDLGNPVYSILSVVCVNNSPQTACTGGGGGQEPPPCPTSSDFHTENTDYGSQYYQFPCPASYEYHTKWYVHNNGAVSQPVNIQVVREVHDGNGSNWTFEWHTIQPGQDRVNIGVESTSWDDLNCNMMMEVGEVTTVSIWAWNEPTCGYICPPPFEFVAEYNNSNMNPCWPNAQLSVTYVGSTPLPAGITYADVYMDGNFFATVAVNNSTGFGAVCRPMEPIGLFFTVDHVECQFDGGPGGGGGGFTCPTAGQFTTGYIGCLSDGYAITAAYTGSSLPFPSNKKVTVTCFVTFTNGQTATVNVVLNNISGQGVASEDCVGGRGWDIQSIVVTGVTCVDITPPPSSTCPADPRAPSYAAKVRVFNDYVDDGSYMDCLGENAPLTQAEIDAQTAASIAGAREQAIQNLDAMKENWIDLLRSVVEQENANDDENGVPRRFGSLADPNETTINATILNLVNNLYLVAKKYIEIAPKENIRAASTLPVAGDPGYPSTIVASNGYNNFAQVFNAYINGTMQQQGFGPHLIDNPYPYNRTPLALSPNVNEIPQGMCARVTAMKTRWNAAGNPNGSFHGYLQAQLGDDYKLTATELADIEARCTSGCKYLNDPVQVPGVFADPIPANPNHAWVTCAQVNNLYSSFATQYPSVASGTKLHRNLLTNYLNLTLGYAVSFDEYEEFRNVKCADPNAVLYNKPAAPIVRIDHEFVCVENIMRSVFDKAGQEYEYYIEIERRKFRNAYVSKCLSAPASANLYGEQYEYHYTLYYYDQSGNLVKTIPPEGVAFLNEQDIATIGTVMNQDPMSCTGSGIPNTENASATFTAFSNGLQANTTKSVEMWLNSTAVGTSRQVRFTTPDNKYFCQAAIYDKKLWVEVYNITAGVATLANRAVASLASLAPLQSWTHVQVQSAAGLTAGTLQLFVDGRTLANYTPGSEPAYPFAWGPSPIPAQDVAVLKHMRIYDRTGTPAEVMENYRNTCLAPVGALAVQNSPLQFWGRFNIPAYCSAGDPSTAREINNNGSLRITGTGPAVNSQNVTTAVNDFTVEMWVNPEVAHEIDIESQSGYSGIAGQRYAIYPSYGGSAATNNAHMGISVGTNGVSVYEHADSYMPALLSWSGNMSGWHHIAVVYQNRTPRLYVDGSLVRIGLQSLKATVSPSYNFGGGDAMYGAFTDGRIDEVRIWGVARTAQEIAANYNKGLLPGTANLAGYWPMSSNDVTIINDVTCNNRDLALIANEEWSSITSTVKDLTIVESASYFIVPDHTLASSFAYNSFDKVVKQTTPDEGLSEFYYDRLGRLTISQNAEQRLPAIVNAENPANRFSYTRYDLLGRVVELGEKLGASTVTELQARDESFLQPWLNSGTNRQVTVTAYEEVPAWTPASLAGTQFNLRNRVVAKAILSTSGNPANAALNRLAATYYSYDIVGNVKELVQENTAMATPETGGNGLKKLKYEYELASGNVTKVLYQDGKWDQFYYHYKYNADQKISSAWSSRLNTHTPSDATDPDWRLEATYRYHLHGGLARTELGRDKVQGIDLAYTLQGWLKGMNSQALDPNKDIGGDGKLGNNSYFVHNARDVFAFTLGYFANDYKPVDPALTPATNAFNMQYTQPLPADPVKSGAGLYDGTISHSTYAIAQIDNGNTTGYTYRNDQLGRSKVVNKHNLAPGTTAWNNTSVVQDYNETISYDANGNITSYNRKANGGVMMDQLTYGYNVDNQGKLVNNRLRHVKDPTNPSAFPEDIDDQVNDNYMYDNLGNLVKDGNVVTRVDWTVYGKITRVTKGNGHIISYKYDAMGHRIEKKVDKGSTEGIVTTYYVRDGQGTVMGVYDHNQPQGPATYTWKEQSLFGRGRLGTATPNLVYNGNINYNPTGDPLNNGILGQRMYELSNHLGNVMAVISDAKTGVDEGSNGTTDYYVANVLYANDYYPGGLVQPGRSYTAGGQYRYGLNGQEKSGEIAEGTYTARFWEYDSRIVRRWNVDPQPMMGVSGYNCFGGNPVFYADYFGDKLKGHNATSGTRMRDEIRNTFTGAKAQKLRDLFKLDADGKTMSTISEQDFIDAVAGLPPDVQKLAYSYYSAINDPATMTVEMTKIGEALSNRAKTASGKTTVAEFDLLTGGGGNWTVSGKNTYTVIVMNSAHAKPLDNKTSATSGYAAFTSSVGELMAHEILGHGFGLAKGTTTYENADAIQMTNLYRRTQGIAYYRDGAQHDGGIVAAPTATPSYTTIPTAMQTKISAIETAQRQAEDKARMEAEFRRQDYLNRNMRNDRLINRTGPFRPVQPMGGW